MTTLRQRKKCLRSGWKKGHLRAFACPSDAKPALSRRLWQHREAKLAKTLQSEAPSVYTVSWMEGQNGNPGSNEQ
jgi:hypothetical protein